jgi:four helix bundle protein
LLIEFIGAGGDSIGRHERGTVRADAAVMQSETEALRARTKRFTLDVLGFLRTLPGTDECRDIAGQLRRSAGGVGANYRATCRARARSEFIARINVALEEADESGFWLEVIAEGKLSPSSRANELLDESNQLCAIFTASSITATEAERRGDPDPHRRGVKRH